jgi:UDP-GlcNAc:undecaprenyl-phosphate/decaprenyl-phosphate GlcNAc-1-phosphate transferase
MLHFTAGQWLILGVSFVLSVLCTRLVRSFARQSGMVAKPRADRWHKKPTALLGGVAIFLTVMAVTLTTALLATDFSAKVWYVLGGSTLLWLIGLVDDLVHMKPYQKLIGQVLGAAIVIHGDLLLQWTPVPLVNMGLTVLWIVGITNAINLLDNMDGLAAGISAIAAVILGIHLLQHGYVAEAFLLGVLTGALIGFLVYNTCPASIFMGDCGSMFIGFFLASAALLIDSAGRSRSLLPVLAVPVLVLCIPIFDVTLVTVLRKLAGRSLSQGGRDHSSHRLVALGLTEFRAVLLLYALAIVAGGLALAVRDLQVDVSLALIGAFTLLLTLLGTALAGVRVYDEEEIRAARETLLIGFLVDLSYKRRVFEVLLDVGLIVLAYYGAYTVALGPPSENGGLGAFMDVIPVLLFVKLATFLAMGVYRGIWRYVGMDNLIVYAKAVFVASVLSVIAMVFVFRFAGLSRVVFVLDCMFMFALLAGSRLAFRFFRHVLPIAVSLRGRALAA